jgi:hypothetical protein
LKVDERAREIKAAIGIGRAQAGDRLKAQGDFAFELRAQKRSEESGGEKKGGELLHGGVRGGTVGGCPAVSTSGIVIN